MAIRYFAGLDLSQARVIRTLNKRYKARMVVHDRIGAFRSVALALNHIGPDVDSVLKAQQLQGWPTPILRALSRSIASV